MLQNNKIPQLEPVYSRMTQLFLFFKKNKLTGNFAPRINFSAGGCTNIKYEINETMPLKENNKFE